MKPKLIILSDLWGLKNGDWMKEYVAILECNFEIVVYDSCLLGEIDATNYYEVKLHEQFVNGGIERAVANLLISEKEKINILAFSVGGTIAWKAALKGLNVENLFAVSSTRLRYENEIPNSTIKLYFGENDNNKPTDDWFGKISVDFEIIKNREHHFYTEMDFITSICDEILK